MADIFDKCAEFWARMSTLAGPAAVDELRATFFRRFPVVNCTPTIVVDGREMLQVAVNDYLGLAMHPEVVEAAAQACRAHGVGTPLGARPLTGNTAAHEELEAELAAFRRTEDAMVHNLGLSAMSGTIASLVGRGEWIFVDAQAHGCVHDGARLCKGTARWFGHNDIEDLERQLAEAPRDAAKLIAVDGVYGMTGDVAPVPALVALKRKYNARLFVDDAHGTGVLGPHGRGTCEMFGVEDDVDLHGGTFAKSFGTFGGYICGPRPILQFLRHVSPGYVLTKALPAPIVAATRVSLRLMQSLPERRRALWENVDALRAGLRRAGFDVGDPVGAVTAMPTRGVVALQAVKLLQERHAIIVNPVMYPAVPYGLSVIRMTPGALHAPDQMQRLVDALVEVADTIPLREANHAAVRRRPPDDAPR